MRNLVPIKVKIGTKIEGGAKYPLFNNLNLMKDMIKDWENNGKQVILEDLVSKGMTNAQANIQVEKQRPDWAKYIDSDGSGWLYDSVGHQEEESESPVGQQWGMILVPKKFAQEAVAMFPEVTKMTEAECITFYDTRHAKEFDEEEVDTEKLAQIKSKEDAGVSLTQADADARDPSKDARGIRTNWRKKWANYKVKKGIKVVQ